MRRADVGAEGADRWAGGAWRRPRVLKTLRRRCGSLPVGRWTNSLRVGRESRSSSAQALVACPPALASAPSSTGLEQRDVAHHQRQAPQ